MSNDREGVAALASESATIQQSGEQNGVAPKLKKVFIAIPIYGAVDHHFFTCAMKLQQEMLMSGIHGALRPHFGDSAVGRARNALTREFLDSDCTHLLFIDSDLVFSAEHIKRIMEHEEPIVGGLYCKKQEGNPPQLVVNALMKEAPVRPDGLQEVRYVGTGFIRVAREVFEKVIEAHKDEIQYQTDWDNKLTEWDFWTMGVYHYKDGSRPRWLSEDWYFCQRAIDLGYKVYVDMAILLKHSGNVLYPLSYQEKCLYPVKCPEGFVYGADCGDTINEVFGGEYDFAIPPFPTPPRILDIGANAGAFAWWANSRWPGSRITCYEPNPANFEFLEKNCQTLGATPIKLAVGDTKLNKLFLGKRNNLTGSQYFNGEQSQQTIPIAVLEPALLPEADLIKIDTEGSEVDIVSGLQQIPTYMIVEYHSAENKQKVSDLLRGKMIMIGMKETSSNGGILAFKKV